MSIRQRSVRGSAWRAVVLTCVVAGCGSSSAAPPAMPTVSATPVIESPALPASAPLPAAATAAASTGAASAPATPVIDVDDNALPGGGGAGALPTPVATRAPSTSAAGHLPGEPDPTFTPGAFNPAVTQATIGSTICVSGWTATVRPPSSYTTSLKVEQIGEYGYTDTRTSSYEEDHLIPLELGGAPSDPRNLWPEPYTATLPDGRNAGARVKDEYETDLKKDVCAGTMTLAQARQRIGDDWVHYFYAIPLGVSATAAPGRTPAATPRPTVAPAPAGTPVPQAGSLSVRFVSLPDPAVPGSTATLTAVTAPGAVCSAMVTWPSGTVSTAAGLKPTPTAGSDGVVSWTWNVGSRTKPGTATARVTCTLGGSASATAHFPVA